MMLMLLPPRFIIRLMGTHHAKKYGEAGCVKWIQNILERALSTYYRRVARLEAQNFLIRRDLPAKLATFYAIESDSSPGDSPSNTIRMNATREARKAPLIDEFVRAYAQLMTNYESAELVMAVQAKKIRAAICAFITGASKLIPDFDPTVELPYWSLLESNRHVWSGLDAQLAVFANKTQEVQHEA